MILTTRPARQRSGVAAVEFALLLPFIMITLLGLWDVGRLVQVQQLVDNAAREGARLAALGVLLDPTTATTRDIYATDVTNTVINYLTRNGITTTGISVTFTDLTNPGVTDPYLATQLDQLQVTVTMPFDNVRWMLLDKVSGQTNLGATSYWYSMVDSQVTVSTTIPY